jgi:hypothetical protein
MVIVSVLLFSYYDQFWMAADDGYYAQTASRVLAGEIPHRDFHEFHPGLILWTNVLSFKLFGQDLASLRIPLVILGLIQAPLIYKMVEPYGRVSAGIALVLVGAMGLPAIQNPSANLYVLFFAIATLYVAGKPMLFKDPRTMVSLGLLLGVCVLFRHLSGVLLGIGLTIWMLTHPATQTDQKPSLIGRGLVAIALIGLMGYSLGRSDGFGLFLYALPALLIAILATVRARPDPTHTMWILKWAGLGFILSFAPLIIQQMIIGTLGAWAYDVFILPLTLINMAFIGDWHFSLLLGQILSTLPLIENPIQGLNFITWIGFITLPAIFGFWISRRYLKGQDTLATKNKTSKGIPAFVFCAPFYLVGILHFEISLYLLWGIPIILMAGFYLFHQSNYWHKKGLVIMTTLSLGCFTALIGQPVWQGTVGDFVLGMSGKYNTILLEGRGGVYLPQDEQEFYNRMSTLIIEKAINNKQLFSFPTHPEWNYLTGLKNPTPHIFAGITMNSPSKLAQLKAQFTSTPPDVIIFDPNDKYNTEFTRGFRAWLSNQYVVFHEENDFEFLIKKKPSNQP